MNVNNSKVSTVIVPNMTFAKGQTILFCIKYSLERESIY